MTTVHRRTLKKIKDLTVADSTVILNDVQRHVMARAVEPDLDRRSDILHPSEMAKASWCWRHDYYRIRGTPIDPSTSSPSFHMENVFEEGHGIHRKWQGWLHEMGVLYGVFFCTECHERWWDTAPMTCPHCGSLRMPRYREIPLEAPELCIAGHSDGGIYKGDVLRLLEVKSLSLGTLRFEAPELYERYQNNESLDIIWRDIKRPFPSHLRQGAMYLWLINRGQQAIPVPEIVFIYEWKPTQQVKEFVVKYNPRNVERMIGGAEMVTEALQLRRPPKRPAWAVDEDVKNCHSCPYRKTCWKLVDGPDPTHAPPVIPVKRAASSVRRRALARTTG